MTLDNSQTVLTKEKWERNGATSTSSISQTSIPHVSLPPSFLLIFFLCSSMLHIPLYSSSIPIPYLTYSISLQNQARTTEPVTLSSLDVIFALQWFSRMWCNAVSACVCVLSLFSGFLVQFRLEAQLMLGQWGILWLQIFRRRLFKK